MTVAKSKSMVKPYESHVSKTKKPMGDFYGVGVKQPIGKQKGPLLGSANLSQKKLGKPPKTLA